MMNLSRKKLLLGGITMVLIALLLVGVGSVMGRRAVGDRLHVYNTRLVQVEKSISHGKTGSKKHRVFYHFRGTVEIDGRRITLTPGNQQLFYNKYNEGDEVPVYELDGCYSFNRSDFLVPRWAHIPSLLLFPLGLALIALSLMLPLLRRSS